MERIKYLVKELQKGDFDYFDEFYDLTKKLIYHVIYNISRRKDVAEDLMQDTYIKFMENIDKCNLNTSPLPYLTTIARNLSINHYHKAKREVLDDDYIYDVGQTNNNHIDLGIIDLLNGDIKEIVLLHIVGDLKFKDIAKIMSKPLGTVLWLYNKGIKELRKEVGESNE